MKKRIDHTYKWRYPTIIDRDPSFIEFLKTKPFYEDALYTRKGILTQRQRLMEMAKNRRPGKRREQVDLFSDDPPSPPKRHLTVVKPD